MNQTDQKKSPLKLRNIITTALLLVMIGLLVWYLYQNREAVGQLLSLSPGTVAGMLLLAAGACWINALYHKMILDTYHLPMDLIDWAGVVFVSNALAYVLPLRADLVFSAAYYKRVKGFEIVKSVSVAAGNIVFGVIFSLIQMLVGLLSTGLARGVWPGVLWLAFGGLTLLVAAFIVLCLRFGDHLPKALRRVPKLQTAVSGFNDLMRNRRLLWRLLLCLTATNLLHLFLFMMCFQAMGMTVSADQAMFYSAVSRLCSMIAIVPGNIGIKEAIMGASSSLLGDVFVNGVVVSLLQSVAIMVIYLIGGGICAFPVASRMKNAQTGPKENPKEVSAP